MSNIPEFSVSEFSKSLKSLVEDSFGYLKIRGEISGFKRAASGHVYFSLKDEDAVLSAVCFKEFADAFEFELEDGLQVCAFGKITTYGARSSYQIIVEKVEIAGIGAIMEMLEKRRVKFLEEGLFDESHKKALPFFPKKIGVITSRTGAVIQDILHRVSDRCPTEIYLYNVAVQGKNAAREVVKAIKYFNKLKENKPDLLIIARGGGSIEDLLPFSDEDLVREAFKSELPIISAVGHETDFSLLDFVADLRAPTPTAAAEMATIVFDDYVDHVYHLSKRVKSLKDGHLREKKDKFISLAKHLKNPQDYLQKILEKYVKLSADLNFFTANFLRDKKRDLLAIQLLPAQILNRIEFHQQKLSHIENILQKQPKILLQDAWNRLNNLQKLLSAKNYREILRRGFALLKDKNGQIISSIEKVKDKQEIFVEVSDGEFCAYVFDKSGSVQKKPVSPKKEGEILQSELF